MTYNSKLGTYTYGTKPHAVTQAGSNTYQYDANGNMIGGAGRTIAYDHENRPISINSTGFVYDGNGNRVKKNTPSGITIYIDKLYECTSGDCTKYIFVGDKRAALKRSTGEINYYSQDHLGSTTVVTDTSGAKVEEIHYYPYGSTESDTGSVNLNHKYTGQELDSETNLYYYGARYYDPVLCKFISADPIEPRYADPQTLNRYSYTLNNPLKYVDPTGKQGIEPDYNTDELANSYTLFSAEHLKTLREWGQKLVLSEAFIRVGEFFGYSSINAILFGRDFRGQEYTEQEKAVEFCLLCFSAPVKGLKGGIEPVRRGQAGERAVGITGPKSRIDSLTDTARFRVPDSVTKMTILEVKNVQQLGLTPQIRDYLEYSRFTGSEFVLVVRQGTQISGPLQNLINAGQITLRRTLP